MADTEVTATFDLDDLKSSVGEIHSALCQGGNERELLTHALRCSTNALWRSTVLQQAQRASTKGQTPRSSGRRLGEAQLLTLADQPEGHAEGDQSLAQHVQCSSLTAHRGVRRPRVESRPLANAGRDRAAPPAVPDDPAEMVKRHGRTALGQNVWRGRRNEVV